MYNKKISIICGDRVNFLPLTNSNEIDGQIINRCHRKNFFVRPSISNLDLLLFVNSFKDPILSHFYIAKTLILFHEKRIDYKLVFSKKDMIDLSKTNEINSIYRKESIPFVNISNGIIHGIDTKANSLICIIGKSGVGKTTLMNYLTKSDLPINVISKKHKKGKHTTTLSIGKTIDNSIIFDTPGFEKVFLSHLVKKDISKLFFNEETQKRFKCKYRTCSHLNEKDCLLKSLVKNKSISFKRFKIYEELFYQAKTTYW